MSRCESVQPSPIVNQYNHKNGQSGDKQPLPIEVRNFLSARLRVQTASGAQIDVQVGIQVGIQVRIHVIQFL